jgi:hypothetical protein
MLSSSKAMKSFFLGFISEVSWKKNANQARIGYVMKYNLGKKSYHVKSKAKLFSFAIGTLDGKKRY